MQPVLTVSEMNAVDAAALASTPLETLVARAGLAVARAALELLGGAYGRRVTVVAGPGNNGADGRVAAEILRRRGARTRLVDVASPTTIGPADLVIDAAFGTGFRGEFRFPPVPQGTPVLAVDIPSGVRGDTGEASGAPATAVRTVTFVALKPGLLQGDGVRLAGEVAVADIGLPAGSPAVGVIEDGDLARLIPMRSRQGNKWSAAVLVVAGSPGMVGAAGLCARAAYRAGAGMVRLGVPGLDLADSPATEAVSVPLPAEGWASAALDAASRCTAVVVGPGLGRAESTAADVLRLLADSPVPVVVDADGLYALGQVGRDRSLQARSRLVLTPHDGEFARLAGRDPGPDRIAAARALASTSGAVALLKGPTTAVAHPDSRVRLARAGTTALATAGTGDVLSGIIGALVARGVDPLDAAALGAHLHGRAGALAYGAGTMAGDLPDLVPVVMAELGRRAGGPPRAGGPRDPVAERWRPAWADIDLDAVRHNAAVLCGLIGPAALCGVVKADGYGHGDVPVARAALEGGATWLAVALVEEGVTLREAGIEAPVLLLSEPPLEGMAEAVARRLVPTVYTAGGVEALGRAVARAGVPPVPVHLKVDTGMHRVGADPAAVASLVDAIAADPGLALGALWTHLAVADGDEPDDRNFTRLQLDRFDAAVADLARAGHRPPMLHVANSAGTIGAAASRRDMVRCGLALYGMAPTPALASTLAEATGGRRLEPVLSLRSRVTYVRDVAAGERPSYGRRRPVPCDTTVATVPIGYADGVPRRLFDQGGEVLIGGRRHPMAGVVTMDQIVVDCGPVGTARVAVGDEVVLIGRQGDQEITAGEWAGLLGTISYEVVCDIGPRVPRVVHGEGPAD